ncbi:MAG: hypothetical protein V4501_09780 [Pseudomonadota bacterium]
MPLLANDLLDDTYGSPVKLYIALQEAGDNPKTTPAGRGGLGKHFKRDLTREAFEINVTHIKVSLKAKNIDKLWELCQKFKMGDATLGQAFSQNANKHIICLAFLVKQETSSLAIATIQEKAYAELLNYYQTVNEYQGQLLHPGTASGTKVESKILELQKKFNKKKQQLLEQKAFVFEQNRDIASQTELGQSSMTRTSNSEDNLSLKRFPSQTVSAQAQTLSTQRLNEVPEEEKSEGINEARAQVHLFLNQMVSQTTAADGEEFSLSEIKTVHRVFFLINVPNLTLLQLQMLSFMMNAIQTFPNHEEKRFNSVRIESSFFRTYFVSPFGHIKLGNTKTWEKMGNKVQNVMLKKLTEQNFGKKYPDDKLEEFDFSRIEDAIYKIPLEPTEFRGYFTLFKPSFNRWPRSTPPVLERFTNRFKAGSPRHGGSW